MSITHTQENMIERQEMISIARSNILSREGYSRNVGLEIYKTINSVQYGARLCHILYIKHVIQLSSKPNGKGNRFPIYDTQGFKKIYI